MMNDYRHNEDYLLAIELASDELRELAMEQYADMLGNEGHGEYLGGNGQTMWHHCQPRDMSGTLTALEDSDMSKDEYESLTVPSHQGSIEANGQLIVRNLSHWKGGNYDGDKAAKRVLREHRKALGIKTKGQKAHANRSERSAAKRALSNAEARKAKRLARLQARHG